MTPAAGEPALAGPLRAWACGIYPDEAGVELLIGHDVFVHRPDFTSRFITTPDSTNYPCGEHVTGPIYYLFGRGRRVEHSGRGAEVIVTDDRDRDSRHGLAPSPAR
jgi:hypothetical protein